MRRSAVQRLNRLRISGWISPGVGIGSGCTTVIALRIAASTRRGSSAACKLPTTRLVNVICHRGSYEILTDAYVRGVDEACIILDMIARTTLSSGRHAVAIETNGTTLQTNRQHSAILSHSEWRRLWTLERYVAPAGKMMLRADRSEIVEALNLCLNLASSLVHSVSFLGSCIALDFQPMERHTLKQRYEYLDLNVQLSGRRLRRVQRFGQSRGYDGTGIIPIGRTEACSRCSQFYSDFKEFVGKVTNGHQRVPPL